MAGFSRLTEGFSRAGERASRLISTAGQRGSTRGAGGPTALGFSQVPGATYATWNPSDKDADIALSNGNRTITVDGGDGGQVRSTISKTTGKWQWEITLGAFDNGLIGIGEAGETLTGYPGIGVGYGYHNNGTLYHANIPGAYGITYDDGAIITVYLDLTNNTVGFKVNGADQGTTAIDDGVDYFAAVGVAEAYVATANFGTSPFSYPVVGYNAGLYTVA